MSTTTSEAAASGAPAGRPWAAPLVATLLTLPLSAVTYLIAVFSAMGCDSCSPQEGDRFDSAFSVAFWVFRCGLFVAWGLLLAAWLLAEPRRNAGVRALVAMAAPVTVLLSILGFACILASGT